MMMMYLVHRSGFMIVITDASHSQNPVTCVARFKTRSKNAMLYTITKKRINQQAKKGIRVQDKNSKPQ